MLYANIRILKFQTFVFNVINIGIYVACIGNLEFIYFQTD